MLLPIKDGRSTLEIVTVERIPPITSWDETYMMRLNSSLSWQCTKHLKNTSEHDKIGDCRETPWYPIAWSKVTGLKKHILINKFPTGDQTISQCWHSPKFTIIPERSALPHYICNSLRSGQPFIQHALNGPVSLFKKLMMSRQMSNHKAS